MLDRRTLALVAVVVSGVLAPATATAQTLPSGPQVLTFHSEVDDTDQPYAVYLPPGYDASRRYPLVVSLHGAGSNHRLNLRRVFGHSNQGDETDVEASRYVYGTADSPGEEELAARRELAEQAANWSVYRGPFWGRVMVFPRVLADRDVRPSDLESSHLVLFGTRETNSLIQRSADRLPIHLDPGADELGLAYVFPSNGRYVLVSSGLPWWHTPAAPDGEAPTSPFAMGIDAFRLSGMGDFILFRGSPDTPIAAGRFDPQWRLPPEAAQAMAATGAVSIDSGAYLSND